MKATPLFRSRTKIPAVLAAVGTALTLAACSSGTTAPATGPSCASPDAMVLVVAVHANATPGIPTEAACLLGKALDSRAPISIVAEDGRPYQVMARHIYDVTPGSDTYDGDLNKARASLISTVASSVAKTDGDNTLAALNLAGQLAAGASHPAIVVISPGLSDIAPLDFTVPSLASVDPKKVTEKLTVIQAIPALKGTELLWIGNGQAAGTQEPLAPAQAKNYQGIWASILVASGSHVTFLPGPASGSNKANSGGHTIRPVPATPQIALSFPTTQARTTQVFPNTSALGFAPDAAIFRDPVGAGSTASNLAAWLANNTHHTLTIAGTTASAGTPKYQLALSLARAQAVKDLIVASGASTEQIVVAGLGSHAPGRAKDILPNGSLDPIAAETNRTVRITFTP